MPEKAFGSFDVTVAHDGTCIVTSNLQIPDAAATQYAEKIKQILESIPRNQLVMPQPLQQVKFRIDVSGNEKRFDLAAIEAPLFADAPQK
jgi:hypothetical protein